MPSAQPVTTQILELIRSHDLPVDSHVPAQWLADQLRLSRSPVNKALAMLADQGVLRHEANRGYFLAQTTAVLNQTLAERRNTATPDIVTQTYLRIAEDRLRGALPDTWPAVLLTQRYGLTAGERNAVLGRIAREGWIEKKPGYGWTFSPMLTTADSLLQSYRLRLALEPAALLEPGYHLAPEVIARCRAAEERLLNGAIATDSADALHERGVRFHESLVEGCGNPFFIDTIRRINRVRRLLAYRSMQDRSRYREHCEQHLHLLSLLARGRNIEASEAMRAHLASTLRNLEKIRGILKV